MEFNTFEAKSSFSLTHTHTHAKQTSACLHLGGEIQGMSAHNTMQPKFSFEKKNMNAHTSEQHAVQWSSPPWSSVITNAPFCRNPDLLLLCSLTWRQIMAQQQKNIYIYI